MLCLYFHSYLLLAYNSLVFSEYCLYLFVVDSTS